MMGNNREDNIIYAKDFTCIEEKCEKKAVGFFPMVDPDIKAHPYCRDCLDKARASLLIKLSELD